MGFLRQMKDMKEMTQAAPDLIRNAQTMGAQAQEMAAAQRAAADLQMQQLASQQQTAVAAGGPDYDPIAGVSLEAYAEVSKGLAEYNYDQSKGAMIAASKGIAPENWDQAVAGWNERIRTNQTVAQQFNKLYTGR
jgi:hypothetical protein